MPLRRIAPSRWPSYRRIATRTEDIVMERNYWKLATIGIALTGVTALSTGLTTAWMLRPADEAQAQAAPVMATPTARPASRYVATVAPPPARVTPAVARTETPP